MIVDLGERGDHRLEACDLCIIGSGPAGATLARELAGRGLRILVLESGRRHSTPVGDRLRRVVSDGIVIKEHSRERVMGGASTTWAGLSAPLDPIDLAPRPWLGSPGWPISREELARWYAEAADRYRFPPLEAFDPEVSADLRALRAQSDLLPEWRRLTEKVFLAADPPQDFAVDWAEAYHADDVQLCLDATVIELVGDEDPRRVTTARVRSSDGQVRSVRAQVFVLGTGGIENARLLLLSRGLWPEGLGNAHDQVGRCMMNHPKAYHGVVRLERPVSRLPYYFGCLHRGFACYGGLRLTEDEQRRRGLLNSYVRLEPLFPWTDDEGVDALVELVKRSRAFLAKWKAHRAGRAVDLLSWSETGDDSEARNVRRDSLGTLALALRAALHAPQVLQYLFFRLSGLRPRVRAARVRNFMEMEPSARNRITLSDERDDYGQPLPLVRHQVSTTDRRSLLELHATLEEELLRSGIGRLEQQLADETPWPIDQDASHHMGTTRMGVDARSSVVNANLRLHEVDNVYLAGASVFPTAGCANPTFSIVALSIRLARHLEREVFGVGETRREGSDYR